MWKCIFIHWNSRRLFWSLIFYYGPEYYTIFSGEISVKGLRVAVDHHRLAKSTIMTILDDIHTGNIQRCDNVYLA